MIEIILSENDFAYELQALVGSFFPGQKSTVSVQGKETALALGQETEYFLRLAILLAKDQITVMVLCGSYLRQESVPADEAQDWHRHADHSAHPYRTWYKNELKRLVFGLLKELPEDFLPKQVRKIVPAWGTMTGVRPTKIPMNELLQGKSPAAVRDSLRDCYCCTNKKQQLCMEIAMREAKLLKRMGKKESYSLYIGIPFCPTTCLYCSFPSYPYERYGHLAEDYLTALQRELAATARLFAGQSLSCIYIGGGTPTALSAAQLHRLLTAVEALFPVERAWEYTVEAGRPDSITQEKLAVLKEHGIGRISVNPQTMRQKTLDLIGRRHTVEDTVRAFRLARSLEFSNINMDVIMGLPGEKAEDFADTLAQIGRLEPDSITVHSLVVKRASALRSVLEEADSLAAEREREIQTDKMLALSQEFMANEGYKPYYMYRQKNAAGHFGSAGQENIGYAKEGKECLYNILMMEEVQTIAAVGAGASTKLYHPEKRIVSRVENVKSITDYIARVDEMAARKRTAMGGD